MVEGASMTVMSRRKRLWLAQDGFHAACYVEALDEQDALDLARRVARFTMPLLVQVTDIGPALYGYNGHAGRGGKGGTR